MVFWIPLIMAGAQMGSSIATQEKNAADQRKANKRFERLTLRFAGEDLVAGMAAEADRRVQESRVIMETLDQATIGARKRIGSARVAASEGGVRGNSVDAVLREFKANQLRTEQNLMDTERFAQTQFGREMAGLQSQFQERVLFSKQPNPQGPNYLQSFLDATAMYMNLSGSMQGDGWSAGAFGMNNSSGIG